MKFNKKIEPFVALELFGLVVISLITTAYLTNLYFLDILPESKMVLVGMLIGLIVVATASIWRLSNRLVDEKIEVVIGGMLFVLASMVFVLFPSFFQLGVDSVFRGFWYKVSFYTLPAIALETAIVSAFRIFIAPRCDKTTGNVFILYTISTMVTNFLAIFEVIDPDVHIAIARFVIVIAILIFGVYLLNPNILFKKSNSS